MDRIDRQIVHCLQRDGRASFRRIAEVVGVSEQTVARRYRSMDDEGAIRVVGLAGGAAGGRLEWFVRIVCRPDATDALADALAALPDVSWVSVTAGGGEVVCVTYSDPASRSVLLDRLPRTHHVLSFTAHAVLRMHVGGDAEWLAFDDPLSDAQVAHLLDAPGPPPPSPPAVVGADDAGLLAELRRDGRAGVATIARATGWPPSRVSGRLAELFAGGAVHLEVDVAPERFGFHVSAYVWLVVAPGELEATGRALSRHPETSFAAAVTGTANLMTAVTCRDTAELYTYVTTKVGPLAAVRQVEVVPVLRRVKQAATRVRDGRLTGRAGQAGTQAATAVSGLSVNTPSTPAARNAEYSSNTRP